MNVYKLQQILILPLFICLRNSSAEWLDESWIGPVWWDEHNPAWIYSVHHGWGLLNEDSPQTWFYDMQLSWLLLDAELYPIVYSAQDKRYLWFESGNFGDRLFYDYVQEEWHVLKANYIEYFDVSERPPMPMYRRPPTYPPALRREMIEGEVVLVFTIDALGHVIEESILIESFTHIEFADSARKVVPGWMFYPSVVDGRSRPVKVRQPIPFSIYSR